MKSRLVILLLAVVSTTRVLSQGEQVAIPKFDSLDRTLLGPKSKLDSLEAVIQTLTTLNKELEATNKKLTSDNTKATASVTALQTKLSAIDKSLPSSLNFGKLFNTDDQVFVSFWLNQEGRIKLTLFRSRDHAIEQSQTSTYGISPVFHFSNLRPSEDYTFEAIIVDHNGMETTKKLDAASDSRLSFTTAVQMPPPNVQTGILKATSSEISIPIIISNHQNVAYNYTCIKRVTDTTNGQVTEFVVSKNDYEKNEYGLPSKAESNPAIKISNLQPSTTYTFNITLVNEFGKTQQNILDFPTSAPIPELQFTGGILIDYNPLATTISWKPNVPVNSGKIRVVSRDNRSIFETKAEKVKDSLVAKIPYETVKQMLEWRANNANDVPLINVFMEDGKGGSKEAIIIAITFSIPSDTQISQSSSLSQDQKTKLISASKQISDASKSPAKSTIKWQDLVSVGIPLVLKFL